LIYKTLHFKAGVTYTVLAPGKPVSRQVETVGEATIVTIAYDEGTWIKLTSLPSGMHIDSNRKLGFNEATREVYVVAEDSN